MRRTRGLLRVVRESIPMEATQLPPKTYHYPPRMHYEDAWYFYREAITCAWYGDWLGATLNTLEATEHVWAAYRQ